jgi:mannitol-1-phosphate 5-dehydrogenase
MKAVIIGPGRIGCGLAGQLLWASGYELAFVGRNQAMVDHLNRLGQYKVRLVDSASAREIVVDRLRAILSSDFSRVAREISEADLVVVSVGAQNISDVAPLIAAGLGRRTTPVNVLAFENWGVDSGTTLRSLVGRFLSDYPIELHGFAGVMIDRIVPHRVWDPFSDYPLLFIGDPSELFVVEGSSLCQPIPMVRGMQVTPDFTTCMLRKLCVFSTGHIATAYLGYLKGHHYIHEAIRDPEIRDMVISVMSEGQIGLAERYGREIAGDAGDIQAIIGRFENAAIMDPVERVGRDPRRKANTLLEVAQLVEQGKLRARNLRLMLSVALHYSTVTPPLSPRVVAVRELQVVPASVNLST